MQFKTNFEDLNLQEQAQKMQSMYHDFIRMKTGDALVNSQYVEFLLKMLCESFKPLAHQININDLISKNRSKKTLGQLKSILKDADLLNDDFIDRLAIYVENRNKFVHELYFFTFQKKGNSESLGAPEGEEYINFCNNLTDEGAYIIETVMGILAVIVKSSNFKSVELDEIINSFNDLLPDAFKALREDFETKMKQNGSLI